MKLVNLFVIALTCCLLAADDKKDEEAIVGSWKIAAIEEGGEKREPPAEMVFTFSKDTVVQKFGERERTSKYKLDSSKTPKEIDIITERDGQTNTFKAIYVLAGDELKICSKRRGSEDRPKEMNTEDGQSILVLKRSK